MAHILARNLNSSVKKKIYLNFEILKINFLKNYKYSRNKKYINIMITIFSIDWYSIIIVLKIKKNDNLIIGPRYGKLDVVISS